MDKIDLLKNLQYVYIPDCPPEKYKQLRENLKLYNLSVAGEYDFRDYIFAYYDENDQMIAGLYTYCKFGMFYIELLWVDEKFRKLGLGSKLLKHAEEHATKNKALYIRLNTASFQALNFYLKYGYQVFAKLPLVAASDGEVYDYFLVKYLT